MTLLPPPAPTPRPPEAAASPRCGIVPPYLLRALAGAADDVVAAHAQHTLALQHRLGAQREVRSAKLPNGRRSAGPPGGAGIIPRALRERLPGQVGAPTEASAGAATPRRSVHDALRRSLLPGALRRGEGQPPHADESVNEAYDGLGATWALLSEVYGRDSLDGAGLPLVASVHFEQDYDNAFWDGEQMVFGDGDGRVFRSFTDSLDVIAHELGHGLTQFTAGLVYVGQSGALNESVSDVLGALTVQWARGHSAQQADWLIGAGLFTAAVRGVALRSMKAPGTAYDDPVLGKDPQPASMDGYVRLPHDEEHDNGGVHINSGIPNHAFYLASMAMGGFAWERAGQLWHDVLTRGGLPKDVDFAGFAAATLAAAADRHGVQSLEHAAVADAWRQVGVTPAG